MKKILFAIAALAMTLTASAQTPSQTLVVSMSLNKALVNDGKTTSVLTIAESDDVDYQAAQFTLSLPQGVSVKAAALDASRYTTTEDDFGEVTKSHSIKFSQNATGWTFFAASENDGDMFKAKSGNFCKISLIADASYVAGSISVVENSLKFMVDGNTSYSTTVAAINSDLTPTGVAEVSADAKNAPSKYVENGAVVIVKGDKKFNAAGAQVK